MLANPVPQRWIRCTNSFLKTNLKQNPTTASLMANGQSALSAPPFIGLLTPFGSSQGRYLIEHSQCALAASRQGDTLRYQWAAAGEAVWLGPAPPDKCSVRVPEDLALFFPWLFSTQGTGLWPWARVIATVVWGCGGSGASAFCPWHCCSWQPSELKWQRLLPPLCATSHRAE